MGAAAPQTIPYIGELIGGVAGGLLREPTPHVGPNLARAPDRPEIPPSEGENWPKASQEIDLKRGWNWPPVRTDCKDIHKRPNKNHICYVKRTPAGLNELISFPIPCMSFAFYELQAKIFHFLPHSFSVVFHISGIEPGNYESCA